MLDTVSDRVDDYDFELPSELIALRPAEPRSSARLLVVNGRSGSIEDRRVSDLPELLTSDDILVLNTSRVIKAALSAVRRARANPGSDVLVTVNLNRRAGDDCWSAFVRPAKRMLVGDVLHFGEQLSAEVVVAPVEGECVLKFSASGGALDEQIEQLGAAPLPPYILSQRSVDAQDNDDYQTRFAETGESVAAPTAGLHFSDDMLAAVARRSIQTARVRLDVNAGTFRPVKADYLSEHKMHAERAFLDASTSAAINSVRAAGGRCIAVGTTSMRTLESAGRSGRLAAFSEDTEIFIKSGFEFRVCDGMLTNFHLPRSTLFVLVSAFMGKDLMRRAYRHAIEQRYRFFSYGDACLLLPHG